ncbi:LCP family protein [Streptomyces sp. HPF1205]|uniref:LCP family protein n=1 Tax=Streptomyces sp. HPF1205 TaxID=2873262 RepID=UPI001CED1A80|nr:LCP family protein [Streptomyces sp. HPF1205]
MITTSGLGHAVVNGVNDTIGRVDAFGGMQGRPNGSKGTNYLLVGTDGRDGIPPAEKRHYHLGGVPCHCTDTIMLVHVSEDRRRATVVSIPRDTYVRLPGRSRRAAAAGGGPLWNRSARKPGNPATPGTAGTPGTPGTPPPGRPSRGSPPPDPASAGSTVYATHPAKLNEAYADGGPKLTVRTVEQMTGVHIDHYIEVDFVSFMKTVDVLGGVPVCTPKPLKDSYSGLDLPAGTTTLDGGRALQYVRSRHLDGAADLGRMQRQQGFLAQVVRRITSGDTLRDPAVLGGVVRTVLGSVRTDQGLRPTDLIGLAEGMRDFSPRSSQFVQVPLSAVGYHVRGIGSTVKWDERGAGRLWAAIRADRPLTDPDAAGKDAGPGAGRTPGSGPSSAAPAAGAATDSGPVSRSGSAAGSAPGSAPGSPPGSAPPSRPSTAPGPSASSAAGRARGKDTAHPVPTATADVDPRQIRVTVENGTTTNGLAATAQRELAATGFVTPVPPRTAPVRTQQTVIRYDPRWNRSAKSLAAALPGAQLLPVPGQGPVMRVVLGTDFSKVTPVTAAPPASPAPGAPAGTSGGAGTPAGGVPVRGDQVTCA